MTSDDFSNTLIDNYFLGRRLLENVKVVDQIKPVFTDVAHVDEPVGRPMKLDNLSLSVGVHVIIDGLESQIPPGKRPLQERVIIEYQEEDITWIVRKQRFGWARGSNTVCGQRC